MAESVFKDPLLTYFLVYVQSIWPWGTFNDLIGFDVLDGLALGNPTRFTLCMEPQNTGPLEKENHLKQTIIFRFYMLIFGVFFREKKCRWCPAIFELEGMFTRRQIESWSKIP